MAEETSLAKKEGASLIKDSLREELLRELNGLKKNNLTEKQRQKLDATEDQFFHEFFVLSWNWLGISKKQVISLGRKNKEYLTALVSEITKKAKKRAIYQKIFVFIPIIGQVALLFANPYDSFLAGEGFVSWRYMRHYKKLKAAYGETGIPSEYALKKLGITDGKITKAASLLTEGVNSEMTELEKTEREGENEKQDN